jgi:hypothetical protein
MNDIKKFLSFVRKEIVNFTNSPLAVNYNFSSSFQDGLNRDLSCACVFSSLVLKHIYEINNKCAIVMEGYWSDKETLKWYAGDEILAQKKETGDGKWSNHCWIFDPELNIHLDLTAKQFDSKLPPVWIRKRKEKFIFVNIEHKTKMKHIYYDLLKRNWPQEQVTDLNLIKSVSQDIHSKWLAQQNDLILCT